MSQVWFRIASSCCLIGILTMPSYGQDDEAAEPEAAAPAEKAPKKEKKAPPQPAPSYEREPAVEALLETPATTPIEKFDVVRLLASLRHPELAKPRLKALLDAKLDADTLAGLAQHFGVQTFEAFAKNSDLAPEAAQFAETVLAAAQQKGHEPAFLAKLVQQLSDADEVTRQDAVVGLTRAGTYAVSPLVKALLDPNRASEHAAIRSMLLRLRSDAVGPLMGMLESPDNARRTLAVQLLGQLKARDATIPLAAIYASAADDNPLHDSAGLAIEQITGTKPSLEEVKLALEREARRQLEFAQQIDAQDNFGGSPPTTEAWHWDSTRSNSVMEMRSVADAARDRAARAATALFNLDPKNDARRQLYLLAVLEAEKSGANLNRPLSENQVLAAQGATAVNDVLAHAMATGHVAAATGAAELLGRIGSPELLASATRSPLAQAVRHPDSRLRFAALNAILKINPKEAFPGSSNVVEALGHFAGTIGAKRALVIHPRTLTGQQWASSLSQLGYDTDLASNGRDGFQLAVSTPDYELVMIHIAIERIKADDLLTQLRKDPRTGRVPVAIIGMPEYPERAERLASLLPFTTAFAEPQDADAVKYQVDRLLSMPGCAPVPREVRNQQTATAISWLQKLAEQPVAWLDLRSLAPQVQKSLYVPELTKQVCSLLASMGTAAGQQALVDVADRASLPLATRQLAAIALDRSITDHGILLTNDEIAEQYTRFNDNAGGNPDTHAVLTAVLDAIETPSRDKAAAEPPIARETK